MRRINKKAQILQIAFILVSIFGIGLMLLIVSNVLTKFWMALEEGGYTTPETNLTRTYFDQVPAALDYGMIFIFVGMVAGLLITSFLIPSHPVFLAVNFIGIFFLVFLAMAISNVYGEIIAGPDAVFSQEATLYPITVFAINYLPWIAVIIVFLSSVIMFAKGNTGG
jgi:hypothetical protein